MEKRGHVFYHIAYQNNEDKYYCRAVYGILNVGADGFFCGKGCPCFSGLQVYNGKVCPSCCYKEADIYGQTEQVAVEAEEIYDRIQAQILAGRAPLFPEADGLSEKMQEAYEFAASAHKNQLRKGRKIPYMTHLIWTLNYASLLTDKEAVKIAALLHDTMEDTSVTKADIEAHFGTYIAELVANDSENKRRGQNPADTWEIRKKESLEHMKNASSEIKIIALSDKTANLGSLVKEKKIFGEAMWLRFNQKDVKKQKWYYEECKNALQELENTVVMRYYDSFFAKVFKEA